jgi:hypothetical protein
VRAIPSFRVMRGASLCHYGLILTVPALLAFSVLSASPASAATRATHPGAPGLVTAIAGDNTAIVRFVAPFSNGGSRVTVYYIKEYGRSSAIRRCDSTRCTILGLSNGVAYRFVVAAVNRFGRSAYSAPSPAVTPTAPTSTPPPAGTTTATVSFNANGGSGSMATETENVNTATALSPNSFDYAGYTFSEWNTSPTGTGASYANDAVYPFATSVTLYAQWTATTSPFTGQVSSNWSGYVLPSSTTPFTEAEGEWTVPTLNCANTPNGNSSTWVGLGGVTWSNGSSSGTLLQSGVEDDCVNGVQVDSGWFELFPSTPNQSEAFADFPVSPGNTIIAIVGDGGGPYGTLLEDVNTGLTGFFFVGQGWGVAETATNTVISTQGNATGTSYSGAYSAEWIVEDPTNASSGSMFPLDDFGTISFSDVRVSLPSGWSLPNSDGEEIVQNGVTLSVPSAVNDVGGFTVTYTEP